MQVGCGISQGQQVFSIEEDVSKRASEKQTVLAGGKVQFVDEYDKIEMVRTVGADGLAEEEYNFNSEVSLGSQDPIWKEKYRPRKPRFINRVHTGFEWNKYNQTHYDTDNPPPKIVQGYKFNVRPLFVCTHFPPCLNDSCIVEHLHSM